MTLVALVLVFVVSELHWRERRHALTRSLALTAYITPCACYAPPNDSQASTSPQARLM